MEPLTELELRVLGCLVEKEATVPDTYPMTLNALRGACNQTSNREPVMDLEVGEVERTLYGLKDAKLVRFVHPSHGERATKYRHVLDETWRLERAALSALAVLMLRGPQTINEVRTRTERYEGTGGADAVVNALTTLEAADPPMVVALPRLTGQKEGRWMHLLGGPVDLDALAQQVSASTSRGGGGSGARVDGLEAEIAELRALVEHLYTELGVDRPAPSSAVQE